MKRFRLEYLGGLDFVALDIRIQNILLGQLVEVGDIYISLQYAFADRYLQLKNISEF